MYQTSPTGIVDVNPPVSMTSGTSYGPFTKPAYVHLYAMTENERVACSIQTSVNGIDWDTIESYDYTVAVGSSAHVSLSMMVPAGLYFRGTITACTTAYGLKGIKYWLFK